MDPINFDPDLNQMINDQIIKRGILNERLIKAIKAVPRHLFVPREYQNLTYSDGPIPIGFNQTISQPYIVALMISEMDLTGTEKVLEIGTGCGYQTAILAQMAAHVISLEIIPELAKRAEVTLSRLGIRNVNVIVGDGSSGWETEAPYDAILISAAAPKAPEPLLKQLANGGRLILPVGSRGFQHLEIWRRVNSEFSTEPGIPVMFVPLRGKFGWPD